MIDDKLQIGVLVSPTPTAEEAMAKVAQLGLRSCQVSWAAESSPEAGQECIQSNDVFVDARGLVYLIDRIRGLHILRHDREAAR